MSSHSGHPTWGCIPRNPKESPNLLALTASAGTRIPDPENPELGTRKPKPETPNPEYARKQIRTPKPAHPETREPEHLGPVDHLGLKIDQTRTVLQTNRQMGRKNGRDGVWRCPTPKTRNSKPKILRLKNKRHLKPKPLSSEHGTNKTVKTRLWP